MAHLTPLKQNAIEAIAKKSQSCVGGLACINSYHMQQSVTLGSCLATSRVVSLHWQEKERMHKVHILLFRSQNKKEIKRRRKASMHAHANKQQQQLFIRRSVSDARDPLSWCS
jgi:hypothetical protein